MKKHLITGKVLRYIGVLIGVIALVWFLLPFMVAGILNIGNVTGSVVSMTFLLYVLFCTTVHGWIVKLWKNCKAKWFLLGVGALIIIIAFLVVVETGCMIRTNMKKPVKNATAVVLGCRVYGERASLSLVERLEAAQKYLEENPEAVCVVSGGKGNGENISEAECMYRWLVEKGIDETRIYKEDRSTSTEENIQFSKEVIVQNGLNEEIAIITSEYHSYRASLIVEKQGLSYGTVPGKTALWLFPTFYVRELYGILAEWIF